MLGEDLGLRTGITYIGMGMLNKIDLPGLNRCKCDLFFNRGLAFKGDLHEVLMKAFCNGELQLK